MAEALVNEFTVNRPIDQAWPLICDLEKIAPCMPGAQLEEIEGDIYRGNVGIKLGSVATHFKGQAQFVERDDQAHTAELTAQGRDSKGRGNAKADISAKAVEVSPNSTKVTITSDITMAGRLAQIGRSGIMAEVSKKLIDEFSSNLNKMIDDEPSVTSTDTSTDTSTETSAAPAQQHTPTDGETEDDSSKSSSSSAAPGDEPRVRKVNGPAAEPIEVTSLAGAAVAKRAIPTAVGLVALLWLLRKIF